MNLFTRPPPVKDGGHDPCPTAPHPHAERRYLIVPGLRSSRIYVLDTKDGPRRPKLVKEITAAELAEKADYSRPHTIHCGPDGIYVSALGTRRPRGVEHRDAAGSAVAVARVGGVDDRADGLSAAPVRSRPAVPPPRRFRPGGAAPRSPLSAGPAV